MAEEKKEQQQEQQVIVGSMPYRVSMAEVDAYGVMYYSRFFEIFERGRTELFRALGFEYKHIFQQKQILMPVVEAACRYMAPVVYDDLITVETAITNIGSRGIRFDYRVLRDDVVLAVGFTQHIFIDPQGRPVNFGKEIIEELKKKGIITEVQNLESQALAPQEEKGEPLSDKLKKLVVERIKNEEKPN
ncbi:acyl-CoA thioesterase [Desulfurobacterium thermolithotrophum]|uniref:acyl-CoA thioesterase n=1 Tax=Desulfurobacterium thermolithotrophum TaxID=64160 RepID=UPI0013D7489E|nr:thioesterase family protein [Desulfurobacterium thermolithotrophum]